MTKIVRVAVIVSCMVTWGLMPAFARTYVLPEHGNVVGEIEYTHPQSGETLSEVGLKYGIGYQAMVLANPMIDPEMPLSPSVTLLIPSQFILPATPRHGLVINLAEYRLYFFPEHENVVMTYPVGIGRQGWNTPIGETSVVSKQLNPTWHPSSNLIAEAAKNGIEMPDALPPGPDNPLGKHVLRLGWPMILIHGTNHSGGIGERVSAGCIRMLSDDIEYLFPLVPIGTKVQIINQPMKIGHLNGHRYVEKHPRLIDGRRKRKEDWTEAWL